MLGKTGREFAPSRQGRAKGARKRGSNRAMNRGSRQTIKGLKGLCHPLERFCVSKGGPNWGAQKKKAEMRGDNSRCRNSGEEEVPCSANRRTAACVCVCVCVCVCSCVCVCVFVCTQIYTFLSQNIIVLKKFCPFPTKDMKTPFPPSEVAILT